MTDPLLFGFLLAESRAVVIKRFRRQLVVRPLQNFTVLQLASLVLVPVVFY